MIRHLLSTAIHRFWVACYLTRFCWRLFWRAQVHDLSKYGPYEAKRFARVLPRLRETTYGTDAYRELLDELKPALDHHYARNSHHPEHWEDRVKGRSGVEGMDLYDFVEMYCDWKAAIRRHNDGDLRESIRSNADRFNLDRQVVFLLASTAAADGH